MQNLKIIGLLIVSSLFVGTAIADDHAEAGPFYAFYHLQTANPAVRAVTGYLPEELIGQQGAILAPDDKKSIYNTDFFEQKSVPTEQIIGTSREVVIVGKDGEYIPVRVLPCSLEEV